MPGGKCLGREVDISSPKPNVYMASYNGVMFVAWDAKKVRIVRPSGKGDTLRLNQAAQQFHLGYRVGMQNYGLYLWAGPDAKGVRWEEAEPKKDLVRT